MEHSALSALSFFATLALAYSAWTTLSLAMDRHYADIYGRGAQPGAGQRQWRRCLGTLALALALAICVRDHGWGIGPVTWLGSMTSAALLLVLQLCYAPRSLLRTGRPAWLLSLLLTASLL